MKIYIPIMLATSLMSGFSCYAMEENILTTYDPSLNGLPQYSLLRQKYTEINSGLISWIPFVNKDHKEAFQNLNNSLENAYDHGGSSKVSETNIMASAENAIRNLTKITLEKEAVRVLLSEYDDEVKIEEYGYFKSYEELLLKAYAERLRHYRINRAKLEKKPKRTF